MTAMNLGVSSEDRPIYSYHCRYWHSQLHTLQPPTPSHPALFRRSRRECCLQRLEERSGVNSAIMYMYTSHTRAADSDSGVEWPAPIARMNPPTQCPRMLKMKPLLRPCTYEITTPTMTIFGDQPQFLPSRAFITQSCLRDPVILRRPFRGGGRRTQDAKSP